MICNKKYFDGLAIVECEKISEKKYGANPYTGQMHWWTVYGHEHKQRYYPSKVFGSTLCIDITL